MANKTYRKKLILAKKAECQKKEASKMESYIDLGEALIGAQDDKNVHGLSIYDKDGGFDAWCEKACGVAATQQSLLKRVAKHKEQVRQIVSDGGTTNIREMQKLIPSYRDDPIAIAAPAPVDAVPPRNKNDWHTPGIYIESARHVLGTIDLDPFTSTQANERVKATHHLTISDDAMNTHWPKCETVWMNPPYTQKKEDGVTALCAVTRFKEHYDAGGFGDAIVLMNLTFDAEWSQVLFDMSSAICCTTTRIKFEDAGGKKQSGNTKSQMFFYIGDDPDAFAEEFSQYGQIISRYAKLIN